jgi:murein DD-endopeptidase MepM/ murein hydrolase activator NlpD
MYLSEQIKNNTILALISGSFLLQLFVLMVALLYRFSTNVDNLKQPAKISMAAPSTNVTESKPIANAEPVKQTTIEQKERTTVYKISSGDTLSKIWSKMTSFPNGGIKAAEAFKDAKVSLSNLRLGEQITLKISADNDIIEFSMKLPEGRSISLRGNSTEGYTGKVDTEEVIVRERTVSYPIFDTFSESAQDVNVPVDIIDDLVDLFSGRVDFRELHPGDSFSLIYEERITASGQRLAPGKIKAISIESGGKLNVAIQHIGKDNVARYFNEEGELLGENFLRYPLKFSRISSIFTTSRFHPILKVSRPHNGIDFAAPTGTPVRSIGDGVVEYAGYGSGTGNMIKIKHNEKYSTAYMHLSKITSFVKKGASIKRGEVIGAVGMTGLATGPHLHFSLYENDKFVNPLTTNLPSITTKENSIPKTILASTMDILKQQHELVRMAALTGRNKAA